MKILALFSLLYFSTNQRFARLLASFAYAEYINFVSLLCQTEIPTNQRAARFSHWLFMGSGSPGISKYFVIMIFRKFWPISERLAFPIDLAWWAARRDISVAKGLTNFLFLFIIRFITIESFRTASPLFPLFISHQVCFVYARWQCLCQVSHVEHTITHCRPHKNY